MADVTSELMYKVLKSIQNDVSDLKSSVREIKLELNAMRGHMISGQQDVQNIYNVLSRQDTRLERIERRLELSEPIPT